MRVFSFLLVMMGLSTTLYAQRIGQLRDTAQVRSFVRSVDKNYQNFSFTLPRKLLHDTRLINRQRRMGCQLFETDDIDGNGLPDLIVNGYDDDLGQQVSVVVLDMGLDSFLLKDFKIHADRFYAARIIHLPGEVAMEATTFQYPTTSTKGRYKVSHLSDTVVFANGSLIERKPAGQFTVQQFQYRLKDGWMAQNQAYHIQGDSITLYRINMTAETGALRYDRYKALLPLTARQELTVLLQRINFPTLRDKYEVDGYDMATVIMTLTYNNGRVKRISDRGQYSTFGLNALYDKLWELWPRLTWQHTGVVDEGGLNTPGQ